MQAGFTSIPSSDARRRLSSVLGTRPNMMGFLSLSRMWAGIAGQALPNNAGIELAITIHDGTYTTDFASATLPRDPKATPAEHAAATEKYILKTLKLFSTEHICKFVGAGVTVALLNEAPNLCTRLWLDLDIVPIVFDVKPFVKDAKENPTRGHRSVSPTPTTAIANAGLIPRSLDEQSDSAVRKCLMYFGPAGPRLTIGAKNEVTVDADGKIHLIDDINEYKNTVSPGTWNSVMKYATELKDKKVKIGFFSSTPQGGGVALMRHALIRFLRMLDVDCKWYVPNPSPAVFRTTKNNHNILQGVAAPSLRLTTEAKQAFDAWIEKNALRYWLCPGGPLAPGGVDVVFIDDPQMPGLIPMIRKVRPDVPIIYRSHIEIRSDLVHVKGSPQAEVWEYLWDRIKGADLFISHPVNKFVPSDVPSDILGLMPAATDWLDGLNKDLHYWDSQFYMGEFRTLCQKERMNELAWPARPYVIQIARFDPAKGIPSVIDSFVKFRKQLDKLGDTLGLEEIPQLLLCGHGAVDDPDASIIYDQVMEHLQREEIRMYAHDVVVMRLPPSDQLLDALMSNAKIALQLSIREGFEVKVSEALHTGKPIIANRTGGIPLQIQHGKSGFLVQPGDTDAVAKHLYDLWTDDNLYEEMSEFAKTHVSDEVGTVGNAAAWLYLAYKFSRGEKLKPKGGWINDLLRNEAGEPYKEGETHLPRTGLNVQG